MVVRSLLVIGLLASLAGCTREAKEPSIVITGATLIDGTGMPPIANSRFVLTGGRIAAMGEGAATPMPEPATRHDGKGLFIFPTDPAQPLRVGGAATFLLLRANPALEPEYEKHVAGRMEAGRWTQFPQ